MIGNRIAETFFWIGRYSERVANHARLLNVSYHTYREWAKSEAELQNLWQRILFALSANIDYRQHYQETSTANVVHYITFDRQNENSIVSCLAKARNNLRAVRERLPSRMWEAINEAYIWLRRQNDTGDIPYAFFRRTKNYIALFQGVAEDGMPRSDEWHMLQIGRYMERAENTTRILNLIYFNNDQDQNQNRLINSFQQLTAALRTLDGLEAFRRIHADRLRVEIVARFITANPIFPRSILFSLLSLHNHAEQVFSFDSPAGQEILDSNRRLTDEIFHLPAETFNLATMPPYLNRLMNDINQIGLKFAGIFY
ncbi:MAG: alpha-E domain-containing protein [Negativicutes bacterium]|nr:alpha-E domain-containing protein [Negativicutes bacterium]